MTNALAADPPVGVSVTGTIAPTDPKPDDPSGNFCQFCGNLNDAWDDIGWWYLWPNPGVSIGRVACQACYDGEPGRKHRARYGVGER